MKKAIPIIIGILVLAGGACFILQPDDIVAPEQIQLVEFEAEDISVKRENVEITTSTDQFGNTVKTGVRIPIKYNFPVATSSGYIIQEIEEYVGMTLDGFTMCRQQGKTKNQCLKELRNDIEQTLEARQKNIGRRLKEIKRQQFQEEITDSDL